MKKILFSSLLFCGIFLSTQGISAQKIVTVNVNEPQTPFDFKLATDMLNGGSSIINGTVLFETRGGGLLNMKTEADTYAKPGNIVRLYPITPYFAEFLEMRKKDKKNKRMAAISRTASSFRIETKVYSIKGDFKFVGLKPGKYYIECFVYFLSGVGGYQVNGVVEIKTDGETIQPKIKDKYESKNPYLTLQ